MWTNDHGEDGLRHKFRIYKAQDATTLHNADVVQHTALIGETDEFVFVMRPETDQAAYVALRAYATDVSKRSPRLADDIRARLSDIWRRQHA